MKRYKCEICGFIYDPAEGNEASGIKKEISFENLPGDYQCPVCGAGKEEFVIYE